MAIPRGFKASRDKTVVDACNMALDFINNGHIKETKAVLNALIKLHTPKKKKS